MVTADDIRAVALSLPRAYAALVRDRVKFRVGQIVFVALSRDELTMGHLGAIDIDEMRELVTNAWTMCVPKSVAAAHLLP